MDLSQDENLAGERREIGTCTVNQLKVKLYVLRHGGSCPKYISASGEQHTVTKRNVNKKIKSRLFFFHFFQPLIVSL